MLASSGGIVNYVGAQGERNDVVIARDALLGVPVYSVTDNDAIPITSGRRRQSLRARQRRRHVPHERDRQPPIVDPRDRDDTITIAEAGTFGGVPVGDRMIGGRGVDVLMGGNGGDNLKGGNGRDSLRGRKGRRRLPGGPRLGHAADPRRRRGRVGSAAAPATAT